MTTMVYIPQDNTGNEIICLSNSNITLRGFIINLKENEHIGKTMRKTIIYLSGAVPGMNDFQRIAKEQGAWVWNINHRNIAEQAIRLLRWDGDRNSKYYLFLNGLVDLANTYFDFELKYTQEMIEKFNAHNKATLLIIYNATTHVLNHIDGILSVYIRLPSDYQLPEDVDYPLVYDEGFEKEVQTLIKKFLEE